MTMAMIKLFHSAGKMYLEFFIHQIRVTEKARLVQQGLNVKIP